MLPLAFLLLLLQSSPDAPPAGARPTLQAVPVPTTARLVLDGRLDEPFWETAPAAEAFRQQEPLEGAAPTERTVVRVAFDENHLYIGAVLYDAEPDGILAYQRRRDASLRTDDRFMWILDTYDDGRSAYFFEINPAGLMGDGLLTTGQGGTLNKDWDGIWEARVARGPYGWSAEIRIPVRTLNFDPDRTTWGINFQRTIRRRNEELVWSGHRRNQGLFRPQNAGALVGLRNLSQGLGLEATPYTLAEAATTWQPDGADTDPTLDAGFDLTYSLTPNLRASLTVNTDFAETEVDQRRVNLTRFPLRFPEQRDFFLEGSSVFTFAPASGVDPYFSRRIGLEEGRPIPIVAGGRLAGQVGRFDVGFLQVRTGRSGTVPPEDFTVARAKAHILSESTAGFIYTRRATHGGPPGLRDRHTLGLDLELGTSTFRGDRNVQFQAFFIAHTAAFDTAATSFFDRTTRGIRLAYPNEPFGGHVSYREFGSAYDPAVGFNARNGFRRLQPSLSYVWLLGRHPVLRAYEIGLRHEFLTDLDLVPLTVNTTVTPAEVRFESGAWTALRLGHDYEHLREGFDILRDGRFVVPAGGYHTYEAEVDVRTPPQHRLSVGGEAGYGGFWTGTRAAFELDATLRPVPGLSLSATWEHTRVHLPDGRFRTHLVRTAAGFDPSPRASVSANVQYDNLSRIVGAYARLRWIVHPGSDLYLVYTHNWLDDPLGRFRSLTSQAALKATYTHRF
ncbi:hypothetical protein AWN76_008435 [Rhodothermaceae bacterium RA]|nr:hypothetical protein AWN76_008435 [Rhodothermaceae bacterium RA]